MNDVLSNNKIIMIFIYSTLVLILFCGALIVFIIYHKRKLIRHYTEKMELQHEFESQLLQSRLEVQEQSFRYFSEEIHDNVGQVLSLVKLQLHQVEASVQQHESQELIRQSIDLLGQAITDLRTISHTLNGNFITKAGLLEALEKEVHYITTSRTLQCLLQLTGEAYPLQAGQELLIFRIIQEAMANAIRHGQAGHITLSLHYRPESLTIDITDDGSGFDPSTGSKGIGLTNMQTRAQLLGGEMSISSSPGTGTNIHLIIHHDHENDG